MSTRDAQGPPHEPHHAPVLLDRCVDLLAPALEAPGAVYIDATLGLAGHAIAVLDAAPQAHLIGIDRDPEALDHARARLEAAGHGDRIHLVHGTYDRLADALAEAGAAGADAVLMDLGLSSLQIDTAERGFSYMRDAPLDMRMDATGDEDTAADLLASAAPGDLVRILRTYGDERHAQRIVRAIVDRRGRDPVRTTGQLVDLIDAALPAAARHAGGHSAKRTFQALRIAVNRELEVLDAALAAALDALNADGRLVIEAYHSLEDRAVKRAFAARTTSDLPLDLPVQPPAPDFELLVRGAEKAAETEQARNPRSASVRLRAIRRTAPSTTPRSSPWH